MLRLWGLPGAYAPYAAAARLVGEVSYTLSGCEFKVWCKTLADNPRQNRKWFSFGKGPTPELAAKQIVDYQTLQGRRTEVLSVWKQDAAGEWQQVACDLDSIQKAERK